MIKTTTILRENKILLNLPEEFIGKHVEIIAFTTEEATKLNLQENVLTHFASQEILAKDWLNDDEEIAWKNL
ncbi:MAG: hypothetical protein IPK18_10280 [Sphingobacteriales bacterium]|jgi:hypothetical protein|nr:MAG: hypothetical protein IPK18_10280 [Sphingobacteriales bacterium]